MTKMKKKKRRLKKPVAYGLIAIVVVGFLCGFFIRISHSHSNETKEEPMALDGIDFVGQSKAITDSIFGQSTPLLTENSVYYPSSGVSVVYEAGTDAITYIDCDNKGTVGAIEIMGINVGWTREKLTSYLNNMGYEGDIDGMSTVTLRTEYNENNIEVYVVLEDDIVTLVCAYKI